MRKVFIEGKREGYAPKQCGRTMTVGELMAFLEDCDEDCRPPFYVCTSCRSFRKESLR